MSETDNNGVVGTYDYTIRPTGRGEERAISLEIRTLHPSLGVLKQTGTIGNADSATLARLVCANDFMERLEELYGASVGR